MTVPILVTFALLRWVFRVLDSVLQPVFRLLFGNAVPGAGLVGGLVVILMVGLVANTWLGHKILALLESVLFRTPLLRTIYGGTKQVVEVVLGGRQAPFRRVVLVEWPRRGAYALGFVTGEEALPRGGLLLKVFVISSPNPTTGFLMLVPEDQTRRLEISVDEALTLVVSGGLAGSAQAVVQALAGHQGREERSGAR
ncbi:MAG: DUF502 domain-containing protein [Armatimonadota bacterium]|nr:DUF502 domain-containing protein [Armatimonadota bacterium]MDW8156493.1 DUF502 domain-containing protein [Armatimonadota bacterium]